MSKIKHFARLLGLGVGLLSASMTFAAPESPDAIRFTLNDWSGQLLSSKIMGGVLQSIGYNVEYVQADYLAQFTGLESGDLDVAMEIWATTGKDALDAATATGKVVNLGETGMLSKEEWWVPEYMIAKCPGLPDWKALDKCADQFATPETAPKGRYLGAPATWGGFDEERVANLPMNFEVVHAGTDAAMFAELDAAYAKEEPIVLWIYQPHWVSIKSKGEYIEFPPYTPECYTSKSYACAKPSGPIWKVAWIGMEKKWPGAAKAIKAFHITNEDMGKLIKRVDVDGENLDAVAADWLKQNEAVWKEWTK